MIAMQWFLSDSECFWMPLHDSMRGIWDAPSMVEQRQLAAPIQRTCSLAILLTPAPMPVPKAGQ